MNSVYDNLQKMLSVLGFSETEEKVILHLVQNSPSTGGLIAKRTLLKRPTVYSALTSLAERGLIYKVINQGTTQYSIADPSSFQNLLSQSEDIRYENRKQAISKLRLELEKIYNAESQHIGEFEVSILDHNPVFSLQLSSLTSGSFDAIFDPAYVAGNEQSRKVCEKFLIDTAKSKPTIRELIPPGEWSDWYVGLIKNPNHQIRFLKEGVNIPNDIILLNKELNILNYTSPIQGLKIKHDVFYITMSSWFQSLWDLCSER